MSLSLVRIAHTNPHHRFDMSMELLCTLPTWPKFILVRTFAREHHIRKNHAMAMIRELETAGIRLCPTPCGKGFGVHPKDRREVDAICDLYWSRVHANGDGDD